MAWMPLGLRCGPWDPKEYRPFSQHGSRSDKGEIVASTRTGWDEEQQNPDGKVGNAFRDLPEVENVHMKRKRGPTETLHDRGLNSLLAAQ